jgi:pantoate--beta-alanine ligase
MTMGALHDGHAELVRRAREEVGESGHVTVTDFVNPTQFAADEDFSRYPRTLDHDIDICRQAGADAVYAPSVAEVYGTSDVTSLAGRIAVDPGPLGDVLEGASRPGHFRGVLTVVATLLHLTDPDVALFGEKDYQQLALISSMVDALRFPVRVVGVPTVREADGLAMSSRNRYLSPAERAAASVVPRALEAAVAAAGGGATAARDAGLRVLSSEPMARMDYLSVTDPHLGSPVPGPGRILVAVRIGTTRLIDNMSCEIGAG